MAKNITDEKTEIEFDPDQLKRDITEVMANREKVASANQAHGKKLKGLEEQRGYHMGAFKVLMGLAKKSPEYIADFKRTFEMGFSVIEELAGSESEDLLDRAGADEPNKGKTKSKVTDLAKARASKREAEPVH